MRIVPPLCLAIAVAAACAPTPSPGPTASATPSGSTPASVSPAAPDACAVLDADGYARSLTTTVTATEVLPSLKPDVVRTCQITLSSGATLKVAVWPDALPAFVSNVNTAQQRDITDDDLVDAVDGIGNRAAVWRADVDNPRPVALRVATGGAAVHVALSEPTTLETLKTLATLAIRDHGLG